MGDEGVEIVIRALSSKKRQCLNMLSLSGNNMTSRGCRIVCGFIDKCHSLEELQLSNN
jgi:hypothetical protein